MTRQTYRRIADDLRERIRSGALTPGACLPTHDELMREFDAQRGTIRRALEELTREGYLIARAPQGVFVRDTNRLHLDVGEGFAPPFPNLGDRLLTALAAGRRQTRSIEVTAVVPPPGVADRLQTADRHVLLRHQVVQAGGYRISIANLSIPMHLASDSPLEDATVDVDIESTLISMGARIVHVKEELLVRTATVAESREMWWPASAPVLVQMRTGYAAGRVPVACWVDILPGDTWVITDQHAVEQRSQIQAVI